MISFTKIFIVAFIWLLWAAFLRFHKKKTWGYVLIFSIFYVYMYKVLDYTLFQFQSLIFQRYFMPGLMLNGIAFERSINLIPLSALTIKDLKTSILNILLMVPFGFGMPFITEYRMKKVILAGFFLSVSIELLQLITGMIANITFRVTDINDVIFNTIGVVIGYFVYLLCTFLWKKFGSRPVS